jgi:GNAT superfamily N-acetyltransferase
VGETRYQGLITANAEQLERLIDFLLERGAVFVAQAGEVVVGMLAVSVAPHPMSADLVASEIAWWIEPERRGGSAAIRLLEAAEEWAADEGARSFQMIAPAGSTLGRFYARRGYEQVETVYQRAL